ncbi:MAG TPA: OsmC family peroxiredoxin [Candidatus Limnocylindrales bacterium]|jgi:osmotically inducible protein OsmC
MEAIRQASAVWEGDLLSGSGMITYVTSGAYARLPVSWAARTEESNGKTSPEELLASAHASCFCMAFSSDLAKNGTPPTRLDATAVVTFEKGEAGWSVKSSAIKVTGIVSGIDAAKFAELAEGAKDGCPISRALKGNVELSVEATLAEG